jgi:hypothetical protein
MRGHHNPLGWAATLLIAVACAHLLLELAAAVLAVAVGVRLLLVSPVREALSGGARRRLLGRPRYEVVLVRRGREPDGRRRGG